AGRGPRPGPPESPVPGAPQPPASLASSRNSRTQSAKPGLQFRRAPAVPTARLLPAIHAAALIGSSVLFLRPDTAPRADGRSRPYRPAPAPAYRPPSLASRYAEVQIALSARSRVSDDEVNENVGMLRWQS